MESPAKFCGQCGTGADSGDKFCRACGQKLSGLVAQEATPASPKPAPSPPLDGRPALSPPANNRMRLLAVAALVGLIVVGVLWLGSRTQGSDSAQLNPDGATTTTRPSTTTRATTTTRPSTTTRATTRTVPPHGSAQNPFSIGHNRGIGGGWSLKVLKAARILSRTDPELGYITAPADALVVVVDLEMLYMGQGESFAMEALVNLKAVGASRRLYSYYKGSCTDNPLKHVQLFLAGGQVAGQICFVIQDSDADSIVMFLDVPYDQDDRIFYFSLR